LSRSTSTLETRDRQKSHGACEAGVHEPTRVSLHVPLPNTVRGGDSRVPEDTAQSRHGQSAPEPSAVAMPQDVGVLTRPLSQVVQCVPRPESHMEWPTRGSRSCVT